MMRPWAHLCRELCREKTFLDSFLETGSGKDPKDVSFWRPVSLFSEASRSAPCAEPLASIHDSAGRRRMREQRGMSVFGEPHRLLRSHLPIAMGRQGMPGRAGLPRRRATIRLSRLYVRPAHLHFFPLAPRAHIWYDIPITARGFGGIAWKSSRPYCRCW